MDGARVFNAATALGIPVSELVQDVDSVMFCLSKGLSAPVGSMLVGSSEFIRRARRTRKLLGGGMRQAGILAAAGIVALEQMVGRLAEDHENCERLAYGLADLPMVSIQTDQVVTNILLFSLQHPDGEAFTTPQINLFLQKARAHGVLLGPMGEKNIRAVTHYGIEAAQIDSALIAIQKALQETLNS
ncbi:hypothetical protein KDW_62460 [Dictyobacter vulcani]|uniref:Aromatic amino acid beta-eliminating lyase/threonine aldolase domain-containing protein n=1 Tax=Dictyobacter vulcani TaxID=2607529 RepID=A0A5J4KRR6_9CHLR|nr:GntG family PLP-dependent aldolase [Dictyobacter vulcani]GER92084.1 hypothetical protein KDW_62460 [Dictyobacter vulcani]